MSVLLENILADLKRLRLAYERRGLLHVGGDHEGTAPSPLARDLLLADGLLRNVVGADGSAAGSVSDGADGDSRGADTDSHLEDTKDSQSATPGDSSFPSAKNLEPVAGNNRMPLPGQLPQVTVFGGTQVGKSTVVNVLAGRELARVHHTAGFTRHAQGFCPAGVSPEGALSAFPRAFPGFVRVPRQALSVERPMEFSLDELERNTAMGEVVLWDAPDCDAVDSSLFQQGFVEALTLADAVVYVTSREKYAVNAILAWVARLQRADVPVVAVLNMTPVQQQGELLADMGRALERVAASEWEGEGFDGVVEDVPAVAFEYVADGDVTLLYDEQYRPAGELREVVRRLVAEGRGNRGRRRMRALEWIQSALPTILEPALRDLEAWQQWNDQLGAALEQFTEDYRKFYLDDPQRYDAFSRVGLEILELLNPPVPGLAKTLTAARTVLSLPARALLAGGRAVYRYAAAGGKPVPKSPQIPHEVATYQEAHNRLLNQLARFAEQQRRAKDAPGQAFWMALDQGWEAQVPLVEDEFRSALAAHRARTEQWIREAARAIYDELAKEPIKLNLLRTGRIGADAAAIVVSIKTGGPGDIVHDLVVAPALMSVVEAVSRQLAGSYVEQRKEELRRRLIEDTRKFAREVYGGRLGALAAESLGKIGLTELDAEAVRTLPERVAELKREMAEAAG